MPIMWVIMLTYHDRSGVAGLWGPYETPEMASRAMETLMTWPLQFGGTFSVEQLHAFKVGA